MAAVTSCSDFGAQKAKSLIASIVSIYLPRSDETDAMILVFWMLSFKPNSSPPPNTIAQSQLLLWDVVSFIAWILYHLSNQGSPRILECVAHPFSGGSLWPRNWTVVSCIAGRFFTIWATREALLSLKQIGKPDFGLSLVIRLGWKDEWWVDGWMDGWIEWNRTHLKWIQ